MPSSPGLPNGKCQRHQRQKSTDVPTVYPGRVDVAFRSSNGWNTVLISLEVPPVRSIFMTEKNCYTPPWRWSGSALEGLSYFIIHATSELGRRLKLPFVVRSHEAFPAGMMHKLKWLEDRLILCRAFLGTSEIPMGIYTGSVKAVLVNARSNSCCSRDSGKGMDRSDRWIHARIEFVRDSVRILFFDRNTWRIVYFT